MDKIDRYTTIALVLLIAGALAVGYRFQEESRRKAADPVKPSATGVSPVALDPRVKTARALLLAGQGAKAEPLIAGLLKSSPYEAELHMLMADALMNRLDSVASLAYYREAVDLNPDYLDRKTRSFQGKKIKSAVDEAGGEIERGLRRDPGDARLLQAKKILYYLLRRIAGSCG